METSPYNATFAESLRRYEALGFLQDERAFEGFLPARFIERISAPGVDCEVIVQAWLLFLERDWRDRPRGAILLLLVFRSYFNERHSLSLGIERAFQGRITLTGAPLTRRGSELEAARRLAGTLFHLGRTGELTNEKRPWLEEVVEITGYLIAKESTQPHKLVRYHGFRGVSILFLARFSNRPAEAYLRAASHLREARLLGDSSLENVQYLTECCLYLAELEDAGTWLNRASGLAAELKNHARAGRRALALAGSFLLQRGFEELKNGRNEAAFGCFLEAEDVLTTALVSHAAAQAADDEHVLHLRGRTRYMIFTLGSKSADTRVDLIEKLDGSISDLEASLRTKAEDQKVCASLPRALLIRARNQHASGATLESKATVEKALGYVQKAEEAAEIRHSILLFQYGSELAAAIESGDSGRLGPSIRQILDLRSGGRIPYTLVAHAVRVLLKVDPAAAEGLLPDVIGQAAVSLAASEDPEQRHSIATHAAGLALYQAKVCGNLDLFLLAYDYYGTALEAAEDGITSETLGLAGETALRIGKILLVRNRWDEAEGFLWDAISHFTKALERLGDASFKPSEWFKEVVTRSKLAETALRLNAINGDAALLDAAITEFEKSKALGNDTAALEGLLADALYRRGRLRKNADDLRRCVELKEGARSRVEPTRENLSVSARVHFQLAALVGDKEDYRRGILLLGQAIRNHLEWPWPLFQMADLVKALPPDLRKEIHGSLPRDVLPTLLHEALGDGREGEFLEEAVRRELRSNEFKRVGLGGRGEIYVVDDSHRLMSASYVFKKTDLRNAENDRTTIIRFRQYLESKGCPRHFALPEPLSITPTNDDMCVYLMRRAAGTHLGKVALKGQTGDASAIRTTFERAAQYLACFHAWSGRRYGVAARANLVQTFRRALAPPEARRLADQFPEDWILVRKKDAHPENWLLGPNGNIVMIDFEAGGPCSLLLDLVQLLDDYPLLLPDHEGWQLRMEIAAIYLQHLNELGFAHTLQTAEVTRAYEALAVFRCAFGHRLFRNTAKTEEPCSMSMLKFNQRRVAHYRDLLGYLHRHASSDLVRSMAGKIHEQTSSRATPAKNT